MAATATRTVDGVEIVGDRIFLARGIPLRAAAVNGPDEDCPIAVAAGIPLRVRRKAATGQHFNRFRICRMMSDPRLGLAPMSWQYGGALAPAPPVLMFRSDAVPFTIADFELLDDFEMAMLDDGPRSVSRQDWVKWCVVSSGVRGCPLKIEVKYPEGTRVRVTGLQSAPELNGSEVLVAGGANYTAERVGVRLPEPYGLRALKLQNIELA